jgi:hypothetical protein
MVWIVLIVVVGTLLAWFGFLYAGCWIVHKTEDAKSLKHLATAAKAFPFRPRQLASGPDPGSKPPPELNPKLTVVPPSESDQSPKRPA